MFEPLSDGNGLARFARARIAEELGGPAAAPPHGPGLQRAGASFVTLRRPDGSVHGCIGSVEPRRPLVQDVEHNALAAAFWDPRADALRLADVGRLRVQVSLLSPLEPLVTASREDAMAALRPGVDGVVLRWRGRQGTLLPQVWSHLVSADEFLDHLQAKAGMPSGRWDDGVRLFRYTVTVHEDVPDRHAA